MKKQTSASTRAKFLSKTQEVLYQKEFKHADQIYDQLSKRGNRS
ncbi:YfhE family protein [Virgibacillus sp. M23]|nr:YfhE family protein [Virgibacillus sp. M23]MDY7045372.1 YfhE family protein [Virgibacillus sp. M23]